MNINIDNDPYLRLHMEVPDIQAETYAEFRCPITHQLMKEPVFTSDGESYEREEIEKWLQKQNTSPATGSVLADKVLKPNIALKKLITKYLEQNPVFVKDLYFPRSVEEAFIQACKNNAVDTIKQLLAKEPRILSHQFLPEKMTALHLLAQYSTWNVVQVVVDQVNKSGKNYWRSLLV